MKYLGVDFGTKRVGIAISDDGGHMGFPHSILENTPRLVGEVLLLIKKEGVGTVVVGESLDLSGNENPVAKDARMFGDEIERVAGVPVAYESEVYTSVEARRPPEKQEKTRAAKRPAPVDASAAALILTSYLSKQSNVSE